MIRTAKSLLVLFMCITALACAAGKQPVQEKTPPPEVKMPEFILHRVLPGETMASIAKWYTGKESDWRQLAQHNPDLKPWNLKSGDLVKVPVQMATLHQQPPERSTAPKRPKHAVKKTATPAEKAAPAKSAVPEEDTTSSEPEEVFGPK